MRDYIYNACEEIDAAMFSGDAFYDARERQQLREYINRWQNMMRVIEQDLTQKESASEQTDGYAGQSTEQ